MSGESSSVSDVMFSSPTFDRRPIMSAHPRGCAACIPILLEKSFGHGYPSPQIYEKIAYELVPISLF
jgi:hypothetical protein